MKKKESGAVFRILERTARWGAAEKLFRQKNSVAQKAEEMAVFQHPAFFNCFGWYNLWQVEKIKNQNGGSPPWKK